MKAPTCRVERGSDKGFQGLFLHSTQKACAAAYVKTGEPFDAALLKQLVPAADRVVVQQKRCRDFLTAPPVVQQHQSVRPPRQARCRRAVARQRDQMPTILRAEKAAANHAPSESSDPQKARNFSRLFNESKYMSSGSRATVRTPRSSSNGLSRKLPDMMNWCCCATSVLCPIA